MELFNAYHEDFRKNAINILRNNELLLMSVRYPYTAGGRDYLIFNSIELFDEFMSARKEAESITMFIKIKVYLKGIVNDDFVNKLNIIVRNNRDDEFTAVQFNNDLEINWDYIDINDNGDIDAEFKELFIDEYVVIISDPNDFDETNTIHGYIPDRDGIVRPGSY